MATLNKTAAETMVRSAGVHACTDITGFGLLGHTCEVAAASGVSVELVAAAVPLIDGVRPLVSRHRSGGMATNRSHFGARVRLAPSVERDLQDLLFDPQTSGGLLISVAGALRRRSQGRAGCCRRHGLGDWPGRLEDWGRRT